MWSRLLVIAVRLCLVCEVKVGEVNPKFFFFIIIFNSDSLQVVFSLVLSGISRASKHSAYFTLYTSIFTSMNFTIFFQYFATLSLTL